MNFIHSTFLVRYSIFKNNYYSEQRQVACTTEIVPPPMSFYSKLSQLFLLELEVSISQYLMNLFTFK